MESPYNGGDEKMKTIIKSLNIDVSEAVQIYIEMKTKSFERPIIRFMADEDDIERNPIEDRKQRIEVFWELGTQSSGVKKGLFFCKVQISMPGKSRHIKAEAKSADLYAAIDEVKDIITNQIVKTKDKPTNIRRRAVRKVKRTVNLDPASKDREEGERVLDESA